MGRRTGCWGRLDGRHGTTDTRRAHVRRAGARRLPNGRAALIAAPAVRRERVPDMARLSDGCAVAGDGARGAANF
jgi:hypothetical protein